MRLRVRGGVRQHHVMVGRSEHGFEHVLIGMGADYGNTPDGPGHRSGMSAVERDCLRCHGHVPSRSIYLEGNGDAYQTEQPTDVLACMFASLNQRVSEDVRIQAENSV